MSFKYFSNLNYTLANEDTSLELEILKPESRRIATICGSGARVLPLFAKNPSHLLCVDLSSEQLLLCQFRIETVRQFTHEEFLSFWGYPTEETSEACTSFQRKSLFLQLKLKDEVRGFFHQVFEAIAWSPVLYCGKWERTFVQISKAVRLLLGNSVNMLFECKTKNDQLNFLTQGFPALRWELLIRIFGNAAFFNAILYRGHFPEKNTKGSHSQFYRHAFHQLFLQGPARENFFLQLIFLGELQFFEGNPVECKKSVFEAIKSGISGCKIHFEKGNAIELIRSWSWKDQTILGDDFDFISMSDVPSYFSINQERRFVQEIGEKLAPGGIIVNRYYLHRALEHNKAGFEELTHEYQLAAQQEKTQMYEIEVLRKERS